MAIVVVSALPQEAEERLAAMLAAGVAGQFIVDVNCGAVMGFEVRERRRLHKDAAPR